MTVILGAAGIHVDSPCTAKSMSGRTGKRPGNLAFFVLLTPHHSSLLGDGFNPFVLHFRLRH
jgi:hypothetical protein